MKFCFIIILLVSLHAKAGADLTPVGSANNTAIAKQAFLWGYPLVRFEETKNWFTQTPGFGHAPLNSFFHATHLATPKDHFLNQILPDVLYSSAFLDLRKEPMTLFIPSTKNHLFVLQIFDAFTNVIDTLSTHNHSAGGKFFIVGPGNTTEPPEGYEKITAPTNFVWILNELTIADNADAEASQAILKDFQLRPYSVVIGESREKKAEFPSGKHKSPKPAAAEKPTWHFFDELNAALKENQPTSVDAGFAAQLAKIGVGADKGPLKLDKSTLSDLEKGIQQGNESIQQKLKDGLTTSRGSWNYLLPPSGGGDVLWRAAMARQHLGEIHSAESLHPVAKVDLNKATLNGRNYYTLRFSDLTMPPEQGVWSLAIYNAKTNELVENSTKTYFISSLNKKLNRNENASLDIYLTGEAPAAQKENWLAIPKDDFYIMMNFYDSADDVMTGAYALPPIQKMSMIYEPGHSK